MVIIGQIPKRKNLRQILMYLIYGGCTLRRNQKGNEGSRTGQGRKPGKGVGLSGDYSQILQAAQWPELHRELFLLEMRELGFVPLVSQSLSIGCPRCS